MFPYTEEDMYHIPLTTGRLSVEQRFRGARRKVSRLSVDGQYKPKLNLLLKNNRELYFIEVRRIHIT